jgi:predicted RND superfamily exporter protein/pimeloyl-ACP methyl ester carboxylesterase
MHGLSPDSSRGGADDGIGRRPASVVERLVFGNRPLLILLCLVTTLVLGLEARKLTFSASFESMMPRSHPFIANYLAHRADLDGGLGNTLRVVVENRRGTILDANYLERLREINDAVFLLPGINRPYMKSLWTAATRWLAVTEEGLEGGTVMPDDYDGSAASLAVVKANIERSGEIGQLVAGNFRSSVIFVPLLEVEAETGKPIDYGALSQRLETIRDKYADADIRIHITGFAKIAGDLIDGLQQILAFFGLSVAIAVVILFLFTRCARSTILVVCCSLVAVVWQLGLLPLLGFGLDPYSVLVPFLIFAIGMSHGAQKMNGVMQDVGRGMHRLVAARQTFRRLFVAGLTALVCDAVGFAVLLLIDISVIRELALVASLGVMILIFTNLILLPVLLSYIGVSEAAAARSLRAERAERDGRTRHRLWRALDLFTRGRYAALVLAVAAVLGLWGYEVGRDLKIGDLDPGAPELRPASRYNLDNAFLVANYSTSTDLVVVMVTTPPGICGSYRAVATVDALETRLKQLASVEATLSAADLSRKMVAALSEGSLLWYELVPNQDTINSIFNQAPRGYFDQGCDLLPLYVYLRDHKADSLNEVAAAVEAFAAANDQPDIDILLAAGNGGIELATNRVVQDASRTMLIWVYGAVALLSLVTFRSWRAVVAALLPLVLTSLLAEALMVWLGIGVKVATLPVTALGVGIGVDYALYILSVTLTHLRAGSSLSEAYYRALLFTGKVVMLTGLTISAAVATWAFSPIKFQADMGLLLAFMFLGNMVGALVLLPALVRLLLAPVSAANAATLRRPSIDDSAITAPEGAVMSPPGWIPRDLYPFESRFVAVGDALIHYIDEGSGPLLLFFHGNPTWSFLYRDIVRDLRADFRCIAVDLPGFGLSRPPPDYDFFPESHAALLEQFVLALDLKDFVVMGQDWGGPVGFAIAASQAARCRGLVIGNTFAFSLKGDPHFEWFSRLMGGWLGRFLCRRYNFFVRFFIPRGVRTRKLSPAVMAAYQGPFPTPEARRPTYVSPKRIIGSSDFLAALEARLARLADRPVLILWGDHDFAFRARERARFEALFPDHETVILEGAGHFIQEEAPERIAQTIRAWFQRRQPA